MFSDCPSWASLRPSAFCKSCGVSSWLCPVLSVRYAISHVRRMTTNVDSRSCSFVAGFLELQNIKNIKYNMFLFICLFIVSRKREGSQEVEARATHLPEKVALSGEPYFTFPLPYCNLFHLKEKRKAATTDTEKRRKQQHRKGRGRNHHFTLHCFPFAAPYFKRIQCHSCSCRDQHHHSKEEENSTTQKKQEREKRKEEEEEKAAPPTFVSGNKEGTPKGQFSRKRC